MNGYSAPVADMRFVIDALCGLQDIARLPGYEEATPDLVDQVLDASAKFAAQVLAPLNHAGDRRGSVLENGVVRTPDGFAEAYRSFVEGGWNGVAIAPEHGGMGLPGSLATALREMWESANLAFTLCPMLTSGAVGLLAKHASAEQQSRFLPKMVTGEWTGTMNLTEPQAGTDLGQIRTRAVANGDHYLLEGQKIFITYGDHDLAENIIHLVLARTSDAPPGSRGLSLFIVPKILVNGDGSLGAPNDLRCVSLEHKLGIHASPTAVMSYGDGDGAVGFLVGEENQGLAQMFTMMNGARVDVGLQGAAMAERAYQQAAAYARTRVQSSPIGGDKPVAIIHHPDVRRMLMTMRAISEASRSLIYYATGVLDRAERHPEAAARARHQARIDLLTPIVKAWCSDLGVEAASIGIQVHGGMGYIEETGAAQFLRDARIAPIYEGTNGIQANDLMGRKVIRDRGAAMAAMLEEMAALEGDLAGGGLATARAHLSAGVAALERATEWTLVHANRDPRETFAGAVPYLHLAGTVIAGWLMARAGLEAGRRLESGAGEPGFLDAKLATVRFFAEHFLVQAPFLAARVTEGGASVLALDEESF